QPTVPVLPGQSTDDRQPILNGTGEPGATITIFDNGTPLGTAHIMFFVGRIRRVSAAIRQ
ncbi:hypothetical protein MJM99_33085, partial [Salmonella enterica subsp. enterica serovar Kentucky]|nr:hypothetical protein [Salmonella enterica subsp. enterica serovar Kentucky]